MEDKLILVDPLDRPVGTASKEEAHARPLLHRAFSIFLVEPRSGRLLLQQRAEGKYHSGGLWANSCCSHPREGETVAEAARRRLEEELGICPPPSLEQTGTFLYFHAFSPRLFEYEYDHVLLGRYGGELRPDPAEIARTAWVDPPRLRQALLEYPEAFAPWFFSAAAMVLERLERRNG